MSASARSVVARATVSTCFESASNSACWCSIWPRTSSSVSVTSIVVLYRFRLLQDSEILRLVCAQISQARSVVHVLLGDILRFHLFAFHAQSKLADFRPDLFNTSSWYATR